MYGFFSMLPSNTKSVKFRKIPALHIFYFTKAFDAHVSQVNDCNLKRGTISIFLETKGFFKKYFINQNQNCW